MYIYDTIRSEEPETKPVALHDNVLDDALDTWVLPNISLRKGIWENFPVVLKQIPTTDGSEKYAVEWHRKNLVEWRETKPTTIHEYMDYELYTEIRLLYTIGSYSHIYTMDASSNPNTICVITMVHSSAPASAPAPAPMYDPTAPRTLDILRKYPICWDRDGKTHYIKPHVRKIAESGLDAEDIKFDLMGEIQQCKDSVLSVSKNPMYWFVVNLM